MVLAAPAISRGAAHGEAVVKKAVDVSKLPMINFGHHDPLWWAVMLMIAIEGTMLALLAVAHIYVADRTHPYPPTHMGRDIAYVATAELVLWLISMWPMPRSSKAAIAGDLRGIRRWLLVTNIFGIGALVLRVWIFRLLPFRWDAHAYGSVVWTLLALQWVHGLTGVGENFLYVILGYKGPFEDKHRVDVEVSAPLWYFIVAGSTLVWALVFAELLIKGPR
jgi:heme/copper-type cytochrome/quinol oxidase subunit 3